MQQHKYNIMVVEDEPMLLNAISLKLTKLDLGVVLCSSGQQALSSLASELTLPDIIWLDYYLEDMNGLDFITRIKQQPLWQNIPVIVVSNSASDTKVKNMLALGVNKYLLKAEYRLEEIVAIIEEILKETK